MAEAAMPVQSSTNLRERLAALEDIQRATVNILEDFDNERRNHQLIQKATLNLLEDMNDEQEKSGMTQSALMNILEDIEVERARTEHSRALLESVNKELEAFSYSVSHDLQAPLRAISGFAEAVSEDYATHLDAEGQRYLGLIQESARKMARLIDDLLSFSRLGRQQMVQSDVDMQALAGIVFAELAAQAAGRKLGFALGAVPPVHGDKAMIRQVLVNLFANAIKFTRTREKAVIEFGFQRGASDDGYYFVKDNGVGFDMRYVDKLFGVFQRLHSVAEFEGTGVGLALVSRIVTRHGGHVWAEGKVGEGATVCFTLSKGALG